MADFNELKTLWDKSSQARIGWPFKMEARFEQCDDGMPHPWLSAGDGCGVNSGFTISGIVSYHDARLIVWLWNNAEEILKHFENGCRPDD